MSNLPFPTTDAMAWVRAFRETNPDCNVDDDSMLAWFANAIEHGRGPATKVQAMSDLRAAVEALPVHYRRNGFANATAWVTRRDVLALLDAHGCYDEAALAEDIHREMNADPLMPPCGGTHAMGYATCQRFAAIIARLRGETTPPRRGPARG